MLVHTSRAEGCSYALQEAIYSGLKIISSDIPENLFAMEIPTVSMFRNDDYSDLYLKMKNLLDKKNESDIKDVNESREIIRSKYSIEVWADNIMDEYRSKGCLVKKL